MKIGARRDKLWLKDEFATGLPGVYPDENQGNDMNKGKDEAVSLDSQRQTLVKR